MVAIIINAFNFAFIMVSLKLIQPWLAMGKSYYFETDKVNTKAIINT